ncbi:hypothetical protein [Mycobacterium sp. OTB74]|uniref:three-helix bundle dimerization domain-containing protein n=1 Tax=Mycobacterium sp. OTB74 TaxID=1853452 RepID=UPI0024767764|nr:hypothetical protein [Mycobacterium sp. OTB74]
MVSKSETQTFLEIEDRLSAEFASVPPARVATVIGDVRQSFSASRVRDFVPLLVERRARHELTRITAVDAH